MSNLNTSMQPSVDGATLNNGHGSGNGKSVSPPDNDDLHRYVTDDQPNYQRMIKGQQEGYVRGSGQQTSAAGLIVRPFVALRSWLTLSIASALQLSILANVP